VAGAESPARLNFLAMKIGSLLAHRGLLYGSDRNLENRLSTISRALAWGFGLETDIRYCPTHQRHYISHDPAQWTEENDAEGHFALWRRHPDQVVALNLKDLQGLPHLVRDLVQHDLLGQVFLFDMELIEPEPGATAKELLRLDPRIQVACRVSDRGEPVARATSCPVSDRVWLDEFDGPWASAATLRTLLETGKQVYAVSPDLHGGALSGSRERWRDFVAWGATGICTDYPVALARSLGLEPRGAQEGNQ